MYEHTSEEMVSACVAERLPEPTWIDKRGSPCEEDASIGCMVKCKLTHPDLCL